MSPWNREFLFISNDIEMLHHRSFVVLPLLWRYLRICYMNKFLLGYVKWITCGLINLAEKSQSPCSETCGIKNIMQRKYLLIWQGSKINTNIEFFFNRITVLLVKKYSDSFSANNTQLDQHAGNTSVKSLKTINQSVYDFCRPQAIFHCFMLIVKKNPSSICRFPRRPRTETEDCPRKQGMYRNTWKNHTNGYVSKGVSTSHADKYLKQPTIS